jgi:hypothetical protein
MNISDNSEALLELWSVANMNKTQYRHELLKVANMNKAKQSTDGVLMNGNKLLDVLQKMYVMKLTFYLLANHVQCVNTALHYHLKLKWEQVIIIDTRLPWKLSQAK